MSGDFLVPLRRLHGEIYEWKLDKKKRLSILWNILRHKVIIAGTPEHDNMGDSAIVLAMYDFLEYCGVSKKEIYEITYSEYNFIEEDLKWIPKKRKLILGVGGGNFGDLWYNEQELRERYIRQFVGCPVIIFPQTVFYAEMEKANSAINLFHDRPNVVLCAREQCSYEIMKELFLNTGADIMLVPDIVLFTDIKKWGIAENNTRKNVMLCFRNDKEKNIDSSVVDEIKRLLGKMGVRYFVSDTVSSERANKENRSALVYNKLREFISARVVVTDRLHGMVFSAITGTPCLVFGNNHHKVSGTYQWISYLPYIKFIDDNSKIEECLYDLLDMDTQKYDKDHLMHDYDELKKIVCSALNTI